MSRIVHYVSTCIMSRILDHALTYIVSLIIVDYLLTYTLYKIYLNQRYRNPKINASRSQKRSSLICTRSLCWVESVSLESTTYRFNLLWLNIIPQWSKVLFASASLTQMAQTLPNFCAHEFCLGTIIIIITDIHTCSSKVISLLTILRSACLHPPLRHVWRIPQLQSELHFCAESPHDISY